MTNNMEFALSLIWLYLIFLKLQGNTVWWLRSWTLEPEGLDSNPASNHLLVVCKQVLLDFSVTQFADL